MPTSKMHLHETKKSNISEETPLMQKNQNNNSPSEKKGNLAPDIKREYEMLERYIRKSIYKSPLQIFFAMPGPS
jgi:hypothetical protein